MIGILGTEIYDCETMCTQYGQDCNMLNPNPSIYTYIYIILIMHPNRKARVYCIHSFLGDNICAQGLQNQFMPIPTRQIN